MENVSFADYVSRNRLSDCSELATNQENDNNVTICWRDVIVNLFDSFLFFLSILVTGTSFMSIS